MIGPVSVQMPPMLRSPLSVASSVPAWVVSAASMLTKLPYSAMVPVLISVVA